MHHDLEGRNYLTWYALLDGKDDSRPMELQNPTPTLHLRKNALLKLPPRIHDILPIT